MWSLADFGLDNETFDSILEKSVMKIEHEDDLGSPELENQFGHIELAVTVTTPHYLKPPFDKLVIKNLPVPPISVRPIIREVCTYPAWAGGKDNFLLARRPRVN